MLHARLNRRAIAGLSLLIAAAVPLVSCSPDIDVKQALQVTDVSTGYFDAGIVGGKNKLVPSLSFRLRNTSDADLSAVSLNVLFKYVDNGEVHDEIFLQRMEFTNRQTDLITVRSSAGFTGDPPQTRADMLQHSQFRDMNAVLLVRQPGAQWAELFSTPVERKLLTQ